MSRVSADLFWDGCRCLIGTYIPEQYLHFKLCQVHTYEHVASILHCSDVALLVVAIFTLSDAVIQNQLSASWTRPTF